MIIYIDGLIYSLQKGGGVTRYTNELISGLASLNIKVVVFTHKKTKTEIPVHKNIEIVTVDSIFNNKNKITRYLTYPFHKKMVQNYFIKNNINTGIFHSTSYFTYYNKIKLHQVINIYDLTREKFPQFFNYLSNKFYINVAKIYLPKYKTIICDSYNTSNDLIKYYGILTENVYTTHLGVNPVFKTIITDKTNRPYFLFVGNRSGYKNFNNFIEAFALWKMNVNFSIITVGGGKFSDKENEQLERLGISEKIKKFEFVSESDLVLFYNGAHAFIFPSFYEGFGLPILEAMACSTIVLASDIPVFREIASDIPYYFDPSNKESIIISLNNSLISNQSKIDRGLELSRKFTWENTIKETIKLYEKILNQNFPKN
jgi:glycosyltransferase involved in cell wall biosynthesis